VESRGDRWVGGGARRAAVLLARDQLHRQHGGCKAPISLHHQSTTTTTQDARMGVVSREEELSAKTFELDAKEARLEAASLEGDGARVGLSWVGLGERLAWLLV